MKETVQFQGNVIQGNSVQHKSHRNQLGVKYRLRFWSFVTQPNYYSATTDGWSI